MGFDGGSIHTYPPINPHGQSVIRKRPKEPAKTAMEAARGFHVGMAAAGLYDAVYRKETQSFQQRKNGFRKNRNP